MESHSVWINCITEQSKGNVGYCIICLCSNILVFNHIKAEWTQGIFIFFSSRQTQTFYQHLWGHKHKPLPLRINSLKMRRFLRYRHKLSSNTQVLNPAPGEPSVLYCTCPCSLALTRTYEEQWLVSWLVTVCDGRFSRIREENTCSNRTNAIKK